MLDPHVLGWVAQGIDVFWRPGPSKEGGESKESIARGVEDGTFSVAVSARVSPVRKTAVADSGRVDQDMRIQNREMTPRLRRQAVLATAVAVECGSLVPAHAAYRQGLTTILSVFSIGRPDCGSLSMESGRTIWF